MREGVGGHRLLKNGTWRRARWRGLWRSWTELTGWAVSRSCCRNLSLVHEDLRKFVLFNMWRSERYGTMARGCCSLVVASVFLTLKKMSGAMNTAAFRVAINFALDHAISPFTAWTSILLNRRRRKISCRFICYRFSDILNNINLMKEYRSHHALSSIKLFVRHFLFSWPLFFSSSATFATHLAMVCHTANCRCSIARKVFDADATRRGKTPLYEMMAF